MLPFICIRWRARLTSPVRSVVRTLRVKAVSNVAVSRQVANVHCYEISNRRRCIPIGHCFPCQFIISQIEEDMFRILYPLPHPQWPIPLGVVFDSMDCQSSITPNLPMHSANLCQALMMMIRRPLRRPTKSTLFATNSMRATIPH